jgi:hypothetical protein
MGMMKTIKQRADEICAICQHKTECHKCTVSMQMNDHEGKPIRVTVTNGQIESVEPEKGEDVDYELLEFAIIDCCPELADREQMWQEMDEYYSFGKKHSELSAEAQNVVSRYEFLKKGQE